MIRFSTEEIAEAAEALDFPTTGAFAAYLWENCSKNFTGEYAAEVYRAAGYIPFCGYPLARAGKLRKMGRNDVTLALVTNPVIIHLDCYPA